MYSAGCIKAQSPQVTYHDKPLQVYSAVHATAAAVHAMYSAVHAIYSAGHGTASAGHAMYSANVQPQ